MIQPKVTPIVFEFTFHFTLFEREFNRDLISNGESMINKNLLMNYESKIVESFFFFFFSKKFDILKILITYEIRISLWTSGRHSLSA